MSEPESRIKARYLTPEEILERYGVEVERAKKQREAEGHAIPSLFYLDENPELFKDLRRRPGSPWDTDR